MDSDLAVGDLKFPRPKDPEERELFEWWMGIAYQDFQDTVPKMFEYGGPKGESGSSDLKVMGDAQAELFNAHDMPSEWKQMLACWFYLLGKVSRMISNFKRREVPKEDTRHDARVYLMMMERLAQRKRWP